MSKPKGVLQSVYKVAILLFLGVVSLVVTGSFFILIFVPLVSAYIWDDHDKIKALEARLANLEKPAEGAKPEQT